MIYRLPFQKDLALKAIEIAKEGYICEIKKAKVRRSLNQNNYMWGVVYKQFAIDSGYTPKEMHQILGREFLSYEKNGEQLIKSTSDLNTIEFENYMSQCRMLAAEQGVLIPEPNEVTEEYLNQLESWRF